MEITTNRPSKTKRSIRKRSTRSFSRDKNALVLAISFGDSATQSVPSSGIQTTRQTLCKSAHRIAQFSSKKKPTYSDQSSQTKASMREFITGRSLQMRGPKTRSRLEWQRIETSTWRQHSATTRLDGRTMRSASLDTVMGRTARHLEQNNSRRKVCLASFSTWTRGRLQWQWTTVTWESHSRMKN